MLIIGNQSLQNKHAHFYCNEVIVHSHPLEKNNEDPLTKHNHTKAEIFFYNLVGFDYYSHPGEHYFGTYICSFPCVYYYSKEQETYVVWLYNTDSRDPPALISVHSIPST
jgi:hypothetical protein